MSKIISAFHVGQTQHLLEEGILQLGQQIFQLIGEERPSIFRKDWWSGKVLDWCMRNPAFKVQMFRLVDVLPSLKTSHQVGEHIREYFSQPGVEIPSALRWTLILLVSIILFRPFAARQFRNNARKMAQSFIVASTPEKALPRLKKIWDRGRFFTLDLLGEVAVSETEALVYQKRYLELFDTIAPEVASWPVQGGDGEQESFPFSTSIKLSSLYSQMDPVNFTKSTGVIKDRLRPIFRKAKESGYFITIDMEHHRVKDLTISIFKSLLEEEEFREFPRAGIAIQVYLRDSRQDLKDLIAWANARNRAITVRLVKGAYWDYEQVVARLNGWVIPVFLDKRETDAAFEEATRLCLDNFPLVHTAIASHNVRALAHAILYAQHLKLPPTAYEIQMLYGMAEPIKRAISDLNYRVCEYTPIGELLPGMSYLIRRLLENTSNESFLRLSFSSKVAVKELLQNPKFFQESPIVFKEASMSQEDVKPYRPEPVLDFAKAHVRNRFGKALESVRANLGKVHPLLIDGKEVYGDEELFSINPAQPSQVVGRTFLGSQQEAARAVAAARKAAASWQTSEPQERAEKLLKIAELLRSRREELAALQVFEVSKTWREADADVCEAIDFCEYYSREMIRLSQPISLEPLPGETNLYVYQPRGVALVIAPWNFPLAISTGMTMASLVAGNTVIYKPSSLSPIIGAALAEVVQEARLPRGVFQFLPCSGGEVASWLVDHSDIDLIAFTGSKEVGLNICQKASIVHPGQKRIKRVVAEMGGKNAIIIDADADLDLAVLGVVESAFGFQGQKCSACSRAIVLEETYDRFKERAVEATRSIQIGDPVDPATQVGAVINEQAREKILHYIEIGKSEGQLLFQAETPKEGCFVGPTLFEGILPRHRLAQEEVFGPVLALMKVKNLDEALDVANGTEYALTGGLYSRSPKKIERVRREFQVGNLYINRKITGAIVGRQPFGGFKMSGIGSKAGGPDYLLQFVEPRTITENTIRRGFVPEI